MAQNILITGGTRGLGLGIAKYLSCPERNLILSDISETAHAVYGESTSLEDIRTEIGRKGSVVDFFPANITDEREAEKMVSEVLRKFDHIDALINVAGGDIGGLDQNAAGGKPKGNDAFISSEEFAAVFNRNFYTCFHMSRAVARHMRELRRGSIVNFASVSAGHGVPKETAYAVAKAAVVHFTRCFAVQMREFGIRVNCLAPAGTRTGRFMATLKDRMPHDLKCLETKGPLERLAEVHDVAKVVDFFISDMSGFVSGEILRIDGGEFTSPL